MVGIYKITNTITGESYIGQSVKIEQRIKKHKQVSQTPSDHSYENPLYRAMRKYGQQNFIFEVIEQCNVSELNDRERYWIKFYDTFYHGYNLTLGGDGRGTRQKKESIIGVINDLENSSLLQREIAEKWHISEEMVQGINTGRYWKDDRDYPIRKINSVEKTKNYCINCGKLIYKNSVRCVACENDRRRKDGLKSLVSREELKDLIRTTSFTEIGKLYGVTDNAIRKWCDKLNLPRKKKDINSFSDKEWEKI